MKPLTEDDEVYFVTNHLCTLNEFKQILKNQEDAEHYKQIQESDLLKQYRERGQKIHELSQLKKRLEKRIEYYNWISDKTNEEEKTRIELQKIVDYGNKYLKK